MTGRAAELSPAVPEPHRQTIKRLAEQIYKDITNNPSSSSASTSTTLRLTAGEADAIVRDINTAIEQANAALQGPAWTEVYTALVSVRDVVQNFVASLRNRRASLGQYDSIWPGSGWKSGGTG